MRFMILLVAAATLLAPVSARAADTVTAACVRTNTPAEVRDGFLKLYREKRLNGAEREALMAKAQAPIFKACKVTNATSYQAGVLMIANILVYASETVLRERRGWGSDQMQQAWLKVPEDIRRQQIDDMARNAVAETKPSTELRDQVARAMIPNLPGIVEDDAADLLTWVSMKALIEVTVWPPKPAAPAAG